MVTTTLTAPAVPAGVVHVTLVAETTFGEVQVLLSTVTVAPVKNPVPVIVMEVDPVVDPEVGEMLLMVGASLLLEEEAEEEESSREV